MKKFTLFVAALFIAGAANAQDMTSKRGVNILPEAGDISISMSANPFLNYAGSVLSNNGANAGQANVNFLNGWNMIQGRYFLDETKAIRGGINIGMNSQTDKRIVGAPNSTDGSTVELEASTSSMDIWLSGGLEFRRGNYGRFQGYYGAELVFGISSGNHTGIPAGIDPGFNADNLGARGNLSAQYVGVANNATDESVLTYESNPGSVLTVGLQGFIGVEYFLAPKVALGGEFSWGLLLRSRGESTTNDGVGTDTSETTSPGSSSFSLATGTGYNNIGGVAGGNLKLSFFF